MVSAYDGRTRGDFAIHALLGVDYLINAGWLVGADGRAYWVTTNRGSFLDPLFFTFAALVGFLFGGIGLGIYFRTFVDVALPFLFGFVALMILGPVVGDLGKGASSQIFSG